MSNETKGLERLTEREREILRLIYLRHSVKSAAAKLDRAPGTVETHLKRIREKLGVSSSSLAADMLAEFERSSPFVPDDQVPRSSGTDSAATSALIFDCEPIERRALERQAARTAAGDVGAAGSDPWRHRPVSEGGGDRSHWPLRHRENGGVQAPVHGLDGDIDPCLRRTGRAGERHSQDSWGGSNGLGAFEKLGWVAAAMIALMMAFGGVTYGLSFLSAYLPRS